MKIYRISQEDNNGYDTYDSAIVSAESEEEARKIHPSDSRCNWDNSKDKNQWEKDFSHAHCWDIISWASHVRHVDVEYIGEAKEGTKAGILLASYNAG